MTRTERPFSWPVLMLSALMIASLAGCGAMSSSPPAASGASAKQVPNFQDCLIYNVSSPTKYVCSGKSYTTFQLAKARMEEEKKYNSGK